MSVFLDGPAAGVTLDLARAPYFLRLVRDSSGKWDGLDQLDDEPGLDEDVFVYALTAPPQTAFVCGRGRGRSGRFEFGFYRHVADAPAAELRFTDAWQTWAQAQPKPWDEP